MKLRKTLSIIAFTAIFVILFAAIIIDFVIFSKAIAAFFGGIIVSAAFFIICLLGLVLSCFFGFGFVIIEKHGFWPATATIDVFKQILGDIHFDPDQVNIFLGARIAILILCVFVLIFSIIALTKDKVTHKAPLKGLSIVAMILAIFGILIAFAFFVIIPKMPQ